MKKKLMSCLAAFILTFSIFSSHQRAHALGPLVFAIPAAVEAGYVATMLGVAAAAGAGTYGINWFNENYDGIKETALDTWGLMSQDMKDNFSLSMTQAGDILSVSGNFITDFFSALGAKNIVELPTSSIDGSGISYTISSGSSISLGNGYKANITYGNETVTASGFGIGIVSKVNGTIYLSSHAINVNVGKELATSWYDRITGAGMTFGEIMGAYSAAGATVVITKDGVPIPQTGGDTRLNDWLDRALSPAGTLGLSYPTSVPYSNTGRPLALSPEGVLLDGVPYTGDIVWRDVLTGLQEGVLPLPLLYLDGKPLHWTLNPDGTRTLVNSDGQVITDVTNVTVEGDNITTIDGNTYVQTSTGAYINIVTGDIITNTAEIAPTIPTIKPVVPTTGEFGEPTTGLDFSPLLMGAEVLTKKFPFSIPWDVMRQLSVFNVAPEAPLFEIDIPSYLSIGGNDIPMKFDVDLKMFDIVATMIRWFNLIIWDIGLLLAIRKLMPE